MEYKLNKIYPSQETIEAGGYIEVIVLSSLLLYILTFSKIKNMSKEDNQEHSIFLCIYLLVKFKFWLSNHSVPGIC